MSKLTIISILCFCFVTIQAQNNITVSIEKTLIYNQFKAIRTTITNNNNETIFIPIKGLADDYGNNISGGSTYLSLNTYDTNSKKVSIISNELYFSYNPDYPLLNNLYRIILKKGQSYQKTDRLVSNQGVRGFLDDGCVCKFFEIKLHIKYFYLLNGGTWYEKDLLSNRITFY